MSNSDKSALDRYFELVAEAKKIRIVPKNKKYGLPPRDKFCAKLKEVLENPDAYSSKTADAKKAIWLSHVEIPGEKDCWRVILRWGREQVHFVELGMAEGKETTVWPTRKEAITELHNILAVARSGFLDKTLNALMEEHSKRAHARIAAQKAKKNATTANDDASKQEAA